MKTKFLKTAFVGSCLFACSLFSTQASATLIEAIDALNDGDMYRIASVSTTQKSQNGNNLTISDE